MIFGHFLLGIFGNIYHDGSGTSRAGDIECLGDGCRDIGGMPYLAVPFGYSLGDPYEVGFLKSIGAQETGTYLSADQNESIIASARPVTVLVAPGPEVTIQTPGRPLTRA